MTKILNRRDKEITGDYLGPRLVVKTYNPTHNIWGFLVIDNTRLGPGKGGIRVTPSVNETEVFRLARAMTLKNSISGLMFGGAKAGIAFDPKKVSQARKKEIVQWFVRELAPFIPRLYIPGPDINTGEREMAWIAEALKNRRAATGKPKRLGGLPHELGSTGFGVAEATLAALKFRGINPAGASVAIEGFGNVGVFAFKFLLGTGVKVVAVADSRGGIYNPRGLDFRLLSRTKKESGSVVNYPQGKKLPAGEIFTLPVKVLIPAALPDVINKSNVNKVKAAIIVEGANIPIAPEFESALHRKGVLIIPDIVANAGGVISSYAEYRGYNSQRMFGLVKTKITAALRQLFAKLAETPRKTPRNIALELATKRLIR